MGDRDRKRQSDDESPPRKPKEESRRTAKREPSFSPPRRRPRNASHERNKRDRSPPRKGKSDYSERRDSSPPRKSARESRDIKAEWKREEGGSERRRGGECFNCGKPGHISRDCTEPRVRKDQGCHKCGSDDHLARECPQGGGPAPYRGPDAKCHACGQYGHFARECPNRKTDDSRPAAVVLPEELKQKPNFGLSGALAKETNMVEGRILKWSEPPDLASTTERWRLYIFKGKECVDEPYCLHREAAYMFGKDRKVVDIPTDHPSCSSQHAVLCYRQINVDVEDEDGIVDAQSTRIVRPYIIDLDSTNGTFVNDERIPVSKYYELREKDVIKLGYSSREYVLIKER